MYKRKFYKTIDKEKIEKDVKIAGFSPILISNEVRFVYVKHQHLETKLLVFLEGSMDVKVGGKTYHCLPGDKLTIPGNTTHSAIVGENGCSFFWTEKIM